MQILFASNFFGQIYLNLNTLDLIFQHQLQFLDTETRYKIPSALH